MSLCAMGAASWAHADAQVVSRTVTQYTHNADGALLEVTVTQSGQAPETTTLDWDNYIDGEVLPANGNLAYVQSSKGVRSYAFDARDRLIAAQAKGQTAHYGYDPVSMMAVSTLEDGASYRFYYDQSHNARAVNILQAASPWGPSELVSSRMGRSRYLSNGDEQLTVRHRKDTEALYDPSQSSFEKYDYDPYGADTSQEQELEEVTYDLRENPFRYSNEYTDPFWGGQYLRARWYDPGLPVFLSRDPVANTSRYGYGDGNPINRVDPSGRTARSFLRSIERLDPAQRFLVEFFLGPALPLVGMATHNGAYWRKTQHWAPLVAGVVATAVVQAALGVPMEWNYKIDRTLGVWKAFWLRSLGGDFSTSAGMSALMSENWKTHHFDRRQFESGLAMSAGAWLESLLFMRLVGGVGYRPFSLRPRDVDAVYRRAGLGADGADDTFDVLLFESRTRTARGRRLFFTSPVLEHFNVGKYATNIMSIDDLEVRSVSLRVDTDSVDTMLHKADIDETTTPAGQLFRNPHDQAPRVRYLGRYTLRADATQEFHAIMEGRRSTFPIAQGSTAETRPYSTLTHNCHHFGMDIVRGIADLATQ